MFAITDREAQIEALWTYEVSTEKVLRRAGFITQEEACDQLIEEVHKTSTTMTPDLWVNTTNALGIKSSCGRGGGTVAHPEIAEVFRSWLFPKYMLRLVRWYRMYQHEGDRIVEETV